MTQAALAPTKGTSHELDALFAFGAGASRTPPPPAVEAKPAAPVSSKPGEDFVLCELVARIESGVPPRSSPRYSHRVRRATADTAARLASPGCLNSNAPAC